MIKFEFNYELKFSPSLSLHNSEQHFCPPYLVNKSVQSLISYAIQQ
jgi:hypothetical protein